MAEYLSERELRIRRREIQREESERRRRELIEKQLEEYEKEKLRKQKEESERLKQELIESHLIEQEMERLRRRSEELTFEMDDNERKESEDTKFKGSYSGLQEEKFPDRGEEYSVENYNSVDRLEFLRTLDEIGYSDYETPRSERKSEERLKDEIKQERDRHDVSIEMEKLDELLQRYKEKGNTETSARNKETDSPFHEALSFGKTKKDSLGRGDLHEFEPQAKIVESKCMDNNIEPNRNEKLFREYQLKRKIQEEESRNGVQERKINEKDLEYQLFLERKRMKEELESYKQRLKDSVEQEYRDKIREEILKKDLERKVRKDIEESIRKELKEELRKEIEKESVLQAKRNKRKEEEKDLIKSIERLKVERNKYEQNQKLHESEDDEDKQMEERINRLRAEKAALEETLKINVKREEIIKEKENVSSLDKIIGKPKLPQFDGNQFEEWKLEVSSLMETNLYKDFVLAQAVRNSLTGKARKVLLTLKPSASTKEILKKMEDIYGNIRSGDSIIHDFYSAKQNRSESCSDWGVRIETLFYQALERSEIEEERKDRKLKERFLRGLYSEKLKSATRSAYESSGSFDNLRKKARMEELDMESEQSHARLDNVIKNTQVMEEIKSCQPIQKVSETNAKLDELLKRMMDLEKEIREIKRKQNETRQTETESAGRNTGSRPFRGGYKPRGNFKCQFDQTRQQKDEEVGSSQESDSKAKRQKEEPLN